ncbi:nitroreductase family protein [Pontibacter pamirensis]|uniref:nitroreductase family protein n=1 Tax=Pontibacter pamirensis TaxID=2562824 RepID=UPI001F3B6BE8|nr:nitroreductase family protein [Pontibacter pamirensis]
MVGESGVNQILFSHEQLVLTIQEVIQSRRTVKPPQLNGQPIPDEQVKQLLALADWAPTHGLTEPWRFKVYAREKVQDFCLAHAELYKKYNSKQATKCRPYRWWQR